MRFNFSSALGGLALTTFLLAAGTATAQKGTSHQKAAPKKSVATKTPAKASSAAPEETLKPGEYPLPPLQPEPDTLNDKHHDKYLSKELGGSITLPRRTILGNLSRSKDHRLFVAALRATPLAEELKTGKYTVFAPTDEAFRLQFPAGIEKPALEILKNYLVPNQLKIGEQPHERERVETSANQTLRLTTKKTTSFLIDETGKSAMITMPDIVSQNGIIHVIDAPLNVKQR
jgi:uncharacterized surface protein with fasciclin (FAS1) repeats